MYTTFLRKVGGSVMFAVPPALLDTLNLTAGAKIAMMAKDGRLLVEPSARPRYTLGELIAQCDPAAPVTVEDNEWLEAKPVGNELL